MSDLHAVTGAFGYSGRHITARLLSAGHTVRTLTGHTHRQDPFNGRVEVKPFRFDDPAALAASLEGVKVLYNTYWVRFEYGQTTFAAAVRHSEALIAAAKAAGVERIVHTSITRPSADSPLPYFSGKAAVEQALISSGISYAILRPAVFFGGRDVLLNNIAWTLRRLPLFGVARGGEYSIQPIHVEDFAALALKHGASREDVTLDAVGPETYTFNALVRLIAASIGRPARLINLPDALVLAVGRLIGRITGDIILTRDEIEGLSANLLISEAPPTGETRLSVWLKAHAAELGVAYASEVARHFA
ncbi:NAD(P)H-binding protein [Myxococcota bacterium]|nr:NAD(P)H-binding protein [Myxococcota bacterium]MBU1429632.1 NAD(P)H-binding protein [Myxococcota bacterium]MBU1899721.1 NAD(P)H-binding protein [Myxococcota bacterium]